MANTFKNYTSASVGTGATTTYTVPSSTTSVMIGCNLANRTASQIKVDVQAAGVYVVKSVAIPAKVSLVLDDAALFQFGDNYGLYITVGSSDTVDVIVNS